MSKRITVTVDDATAQFITEMVKHNGLTQKGYVASLIDIGVLSEKKEGQDASTPPRSLPSELEPFKGKQLLVVRVPLEIVFSEEEAELQDRNDEPKATDDQVIEYVGGRAVIFDFNTEDHGQLTGAAIQSMSLKTGQIKIFRP